MGRRPQVHFESRDGYTLALDPLTPHWLAVNDDGAWVLRELLAGRGTEAVGRAYAARRALSAREAAAAVAGFAADAREFLTPPVRPPYEGRAHYLRPHRLKEVWLHVTDRCNLACRHCLVSSGPAREEGLPTEELRGVIRQAVEAGAETFYFTGGEPLLRVDLLRLLAEVTQSYRATAVVMTNGTLLDDATCAALAAVPRERLYLQVSLDGSCAARNDALRAPGSFEAAVRGLRVACAAGLNTTVATVVLDSNLGDLVPLATLVHRLGVPRLHLMWQHVRERGGALPRASTERLLAAVSGLARHAAELGLTLDNLENLRRTLNGDAGVKRDLTNACWDSLAVHRDGTVYPSACLVGVASEAAGSVRERPLAELWLDSEAFAERRGESVIHAPLDDDPWRFLHGGGDPEQAFFALNGDGRPGLDPYLPLHRGLSLLVIDDLVRRGKVVLENGRLRPMVYHLMGEDGYGCPLEAGVRNGGAHQVDFVHSNCVLIPDVIAKTRTQIQHYYGEAAREPKTEVCSPVVLDRRYLTHIPAEVVARSYGCGSPVLSAAPAPGETVVDLGSGAGLECFIAARLVGPTGRVIGVDMTAEMLAAAEAARAHVAETLGYDNVSFRRGYLEALPLEDASADVVISNCVINLSPEKLATFAEIHRVLKPGGRVVLSDVVSESPLPPSIRFNPRLRGECIAGALTEEKLLRTFARVGFEEVAVLAKTPWRTVEGIPFYSVTVGATRWVAPAPESAAETPRATQRVAPTGCLVCGAALVYLEVEEDLDCHLCGRTLRANARCERGHFVCDHCHTGDHLSFVKAFCAQSTETDPVAAFMAMRRHHLFPRHGPEHHVLVPAAFLTAYRNCTGDIPQGGVDAAIGRAAQLPGGTCGYWGACSAALGIGIAYATILHATPLSTEPRRVVQTVVSRLLAEIGQYAAARCCRRESLLALRLGCELSAEYLPHAVACGPMPECEQAAMNRECIGEACPVRPEG